MPIHESNYDNSKYTSPLYYPAYLWEPISIVEVPSSERFCAKIPCLSTLETRLPIILDLEPTTALLDEIAKNLVAENRRLGEIVRLRKPSLTRAFLEAEFPTTLNDDDSEKLWSRWEDQYARIDADTRDSVDQVMNELDLDNAEVILTLGPDRYLRRRHFFYNLVSQPRDPRTLGLIVKKITEWGILDDEAGKLIEQVIFQRASKEVVRAFLQHRVDLQIEASFGSSALAALFANPHFKIGSLKRKKKRFHVHGHARFTALHYATKSKNFEKVKYLLDHGADPNTASEYELTRPVCLGLWRPATNPRENERCIELLFQYGANPFLNGDMMIDCVVRVHWSLRGKVSPLYAPAEYLTRLVVAYAGVYDRLGLEVNDWGWSVEFRLRHAGRDMLDYFFGCRRELEMLDKREVRRGLTVFDVVARTGDKLFRVVNEVDREVIDGLIDEYREAGVMNAYYVRAMREHMRQVRKFVAHENRAMRVVAESAAVLAPYYVVLHKIVGYLTSKDLLMFQ